MKNLQMNMVAYLFELCFELVMDPKNIVRDSSGFELLNGEHKPHTTDARNAF
jgi:hypothetical protein